MAFFLSFLRFHNCDGGGDGGSFQFMKHAYYLATLPRAGAGRGQWKEENWGNRGEGVARSTCLFASGNKAGPQSALSGPKAALHEDRGEGAGQL